MLHRRGFAFLALGAGLLAAAPAPAPAAERDLIAKTWDEIVAEATGGEVNFFLWGGSDSINRYVSETVGRALKETYGIRLNRVGVADTAEVVNIVLGEKENGVTEGGAVDLVWINGENFRTMKQAGLALCGWTRLLPNDRLVDWDDPSIANDFGLPVDGCEAPWNRAQFAFAYDSAVLTDPPRTIPALLDWIKANPGRFTYPAPPDFNGSAFVRHVFYHAAGGIETLMRPFDQATFDAAADRAFALLEEIEPFLWREGRTYPTSIVQLQDAFANGEVDFWFNYDPAQVGLAVDDGRFPETVRTYGLDDGTLANTNYVLIPFNAGNRAAAMVLADLLLSAAMQLEKAKPEVWGAAPAIDIDRAPAPLRAAFGDLPRHPSVIASDILADAALPELDPAWVDAIETGWIARVGR